jgi:proline racemase
VNRRLPARGAGIEAIDSTLFYEERPGLRPRQLVILERNKFDRSPCGTGLSARMAELALQGRLKAGDRYEVENVLGIAFLGEVAADSSAAGRPAIIPRVTGRANLSGFSTLIVEANDPLPDGFLCR